MRHTILLLFIGALFASASTSEALAQRQQPSPEQRTERLKDSLSLSDEQTAGVLKIFQDMDEQRKAMFESGSDDRAARMQAMRDLATKTDEKIEALLTDEQKAKYQELKKQRQERGPRNRKGSND